MKNKSNRKIGKEFLFLLGALVSLSFVIVFSSLFTGGWKSGKEFWNEFFLDTSFNTVISIFGIVAAIPYGVVLTKERRGKDDTPGRYIQEYGEYNKIRKAIDHKRKGFGQWHNRQHLYELRQKKINYLLDAGVTQAEFILELNLSDAMTLDKPQVFTVNDNKVFFKSLTEEQLIKVKRVLSGHIKLAKLSDQYFLYPEGKGKKSFYEQANSESIKAASNVALKVVSKVILGTLLAAIFTATTAELINVKSGAEVAEAATKMFIRMFNAISSIYWGVLVGQQSVYTTLYYLAGRTDFLKLYDSDAEFTYIEDEDIAKKEFAERVQKEGLLLTTTEEQNEKEKTDILA